MNLKAIQKNNIISLFTSNILIAGLGFLSGLILAKYSTLEVRGEVGKILVWAAFTAGIVFTGTIEFFLSKEKNSRFIITKKQGLSLCLLGIAISTVIFIYLDINDYIFYLLLFIPINFYNSYKLAELNLSGNFLEISTLRAMQPVFYVTGLMILYYLQQLTVLNIIIVNLVSNIILYGLVKLKFNDLRFLVNKPILFNREWVLVNLSTLIGLIATQFDKLYITYAYSLEEISIYLVGLTLISAPLGILCQTMATKILFTVKEKDNIKNIEIELVVYLTIAFIFSIFIYYITPTVLQIVLDGKYDQITYILIPLIVLVFLINFRIVLLRIIRGLGRNSEIVKLEVSFIVLIAIMLAFNIILKSQLKEFICMYIILLFINIIFIVSLMRKSIKALNIKEV
jgi:O-antigen/teichoic acid export membrane protein